MSDIKKVKIVDILESQIPEFLNEESPLFREFLTQYYTSLEAKSGAVDLALNIKDYKDIVNFTIDNLTPYTVLSSEVLVFDDEIFVGSTSGWPETYGILKIDDEIITYKEKTATSFKQCVRGFSGIDSIKSNTNTEFLQFSSTQSAEHTAGSIVYNLSNLFIREFFSKYKYEFLPGFEGRDFVAGLDIQNILTKATDFYRSKGTDLSYKVLFKILYGVDIEILKPQDYTIVPSSNSYFTTKNILVEKISGGDPVQTRGNFLYQDIVGFGTASASIFNVEYRPVADKQLYEISLDSTSFSGNFQATGKTKILEEVPVGQNTILVDSTIGFSKSGQILVKPRNSNYITLTYSDKTSNQFLGVSGVSKVLEYGLDIIEEKFAYSYIGVGNTSKVDFRVINVIDNIDFSKTSNLRGGDKIKLSGFGKDLSNRFEFNNWIYNVPTKHNIKSVSQQDSNKYRIILYDTVSFYKGEKIFLEDKFGNTSEADIISVEFETGDTIRKYTNRILIQVFNATFDISSSNNLKKYIVKAKHYSDYFEDIDKIPVGVQNTYISSDNETMYVTSTGLPNYTIFSKDTKNNLSVVGASNTSILYCPDHPYTTGEAVFYVPVDSEVSGINTGAYFVTKLNNNNISLSFSKNDLFTKKYIIANSGITSDSVWKFGYENKTLQHQKLLKKFNLNKNIFVFDDKNKRTTNNREIGLFVNGVEALSPTLFDENVFYGKLTSIETTNGGSGYDVINPPQLQIRDEFGTDAKANVNISGSIRQIKVVSPGIGYQNKPKITISGGNGTGCILESNLVKTRLKVGFKPESSVDLPTNAITFPSNHNLDDGEEVIYNSNGNNDIVGLVNNSHYFVGVSSARQLKLYNTFSDSISKINDINITGISSGFHDIQTLKSKYTITEVYVKEAGSGYSNRKVRVPSELSLGDNVGINTFDSYIFATKHGFKNGELVTYSYTDTPIIGLSTSNYYKVKVLDNNKFKLSYAGFSTDITDEYYLKNKFVRLNNIGVGTHIIGYPPITVSVESLAGIGSTALVSPILEPVVLGSVQDVYLEDGGIGYGCTNVINFHRRPEVGLSSITSECILKPIVLNGSIVDIKIINRGRGYRKDSDIFVYGSGNFAEIIPIVEDGSVVSFNILNGGVGYGSSDTTLQIRNRGIGAKFLANVFEWKINQVVKSKNLINNGDEGLTYPSKNPNLGLQFVNFYAPTILRYQLSDNVDQFGLEGDSLSHSPIIGYAYDGNPIYGPYGYDPFVGGLIRQIKTGYVLRVDTTSGLRPPSFESGYFVNDYVYTGTGDLDRYNGRFCITPQYPNGTYAYFISVNIDATGVAQPQYPYIVGDLFKNTPITENFLPSFNQDVEIQSFGISRNVAPYYLTYKESYYDLIDKISDLYKQEFTVSSVSTSGITSVSIFSPGTGYKVNDYVDISPRNDAGSSANIVVSSLKGKTISEFSVVDTDIENVKFDIKSSRITAKTNQPHEILNGETILISGISTITCSAIEGIRTVSVENKDVELSEDIDIEVNTGISTYIVVNDVSGFSVEDYIGIGTETLLVTRVSPERSTLYVNRLSNTGVHTAGIDKVVLLPTKFQFTVDRPISETRNISYVTYFDPKETVGTGTEGSTRSLVGIGTSTIESRFIPPRSVYIPGHKFYTGQPLIYSCGVGGTSLVAEEVGSGTSVKIVNDSIVYAVNLGRDYIGLSTLGFTTSSGIGTSLNSLEFVNFDSSFSTIGYAHSLKTIENEVDATVDRFIGITTTRTDHELQSGDYISFNILNNELKTVKLKYLEIIRKLVIDNTTFESSDIDNDTNSILILNNTLKTGDKVVYNGLTSVVSQLDNDRTYFVLKLDNDRIRLCEYLTDVYESNFIKITAPAGGTHYLYSLNPPITAVKNDILKFDLSDSSLLDMNLEFFEDPDFQRRIELIGATRNTFSVVRQGTPGNVDSNVTLNTANELFPQLIYYTLIPKSPIDERKNQISSDKEVNGYNKIVLRPHILQRRFQINVSSDNTFSVNLKGKATPEEELSYNATNISYTTDSKSASGPIDKLKINFGGKGYSSLPYVNGIISDNGKNAIVKLTSPRIGSVETYERVKDGFDYPTDPTLTPSLSVPTIVGVKDIRTIESIGIQTGGRNYNNPPKLYVKDNTDIKLSAEVSGGSITNVNILQNVTNLSSPLEIYSLYNSNGYDIDFIQTSGDNVTLELANLDLIPIGFGRTETVFPFAVGDEIFVESCRLTASTRHLANYNSSAYDYAFFTVTSVNENNGTVTYSMAGISTGAFGTYDSDITLGYVINKKDMPILEMNLSDDVKYFSKEKVTAPTFYGVAMEDGWNNDLNQLRISESYGQLRLGDKITGESSKITGTVEYFDTFTLNATLGVSRDKVGQIDNAVGILNEFQQRIADNFYYQKFSYSIKSTIPYSKWRESVRSIIHPSGFKEFSDLELITKPSLESTNVGISKSTNLKPSVLASASQFLVNLDNVASLNRRDNFALVYEEDFLPDGAVERVYFNEGVALRNYILNKTNKVLKIDDISNQFDGTSSQALRGRYADASDMLNLNREFIQEEVVSFVEYNYPNIGSNSTYDRETCKRDVGYIIDAIAHDIKYNSNNKSVEAGLAYWNAGSSYVSNETEETLFAYNYVKFLSQYVINNQSPPTLYQTAVDQEFNFALIQDPTNETLYRNKDARNLIVANKKEILDKSLASIAVSFPDFYFPGDNQTNGRSRYYDGYRLIQQNRQEIIDTTWSNLILTYPDVSSTQDKCKRDIGYFVDAISTDIFTGGNKYSREFVQKYFDVSGTTPISNGLVGEETQSIYAFEQARDLMKSAVRNGLTIKDLTVTAGPPVVGVGSTVSNTSTSACQDVQNNISTLVSLVTIVIGAGNTASLPSINVGTYTTGGLKCYRDLGYIIDAVAEDVNYGTNQHIMYATKKYFSGAGVALTTGLIGEEQESVVAFHSLRDYCSKAVTNQLNVRDLTIVADPVTGFNTDPNSCANIRSNISNLVGILTSAVISGSLSGIPTTNIGSTDCADVRSAIVNYVGIVTTIVGLGSNFAPTSITYPSLSRGGSIVGLSTFKLKNKGFPLFKREFSGLSTTVIDLQGNQFVLPNHNFQSGQELIYSYTGNPIGIATTSYVSGDVDVITGIGSINGGAILQNGYNNDVGAEIGISTVLVPVGPTSKVVLSAIGNGDLSGVNATFDVLITYSASTGNALSTSITLKTGGSQFVVGETVSIAGTYMGGATPTNDLSFVVTSTTATQIQAQANASYVNIPSSVTGVGSEALFTVTRDNDGRLENVFIVNGGSGYASTSLVSIAGTYIGGVVPDDDISFYPSFLGTNKLPRSLFVYKIDDNKFKVSGLSTSVFVDLLSYGTGTHTLEYKEPNSSVVITVDGVIQGPLRRKSLEVSLGDPVSSASTTVLTISSGINSLSNGDVINIDQEYVSIKTIGVIAEDKVEVERGYLGTNSGVHTIGAASTVLNGDFNIVGDTLYFTTPPYGKIGPAGLQTGSIFAGRVLSRQFDPSKPQDKNVILDDISLSFTGIAATEFTVKVNGNTTTSLFNDVNSGVDINNNPILLINNVFQEPRTDYTIDGTSENVIRFLTGTPSAGRISKVTQSPNYGYIPFKGATAVANVSVAGTISSIDIIGIGSGYRLPPSVSIASTIGYGASATASVGASGTITGFTIVNAGSGYTTSSPPEVVIGIPTGYSNLGVAYTGGTSGVGQNAKVSVVVGQGSSVISFKIDNPGIGYKVGDILKVPDLLTRTGFRSDILNISNFTYDNITGINTVTTTDVHGLSQNDVVRLAGAAFTCGYDEVGIKSFSYDNATGICTVTTYSPHGVLRTDVDENKTSTEVFLHNLPFACAEEHSGITTTIFPDGTSPYGKVFPALTSIGNTVFTINAGVSTIPHIFVGWPEIGISTFVYDNLTGISTVTTVQPHQINANDMVTLKDLPFSCTSIGSTFNIIGVDYNNYAGITTIILDSDHGYLVGDYARLADIEFSCDSWLGISTSNITNLTYDEVSGIVTVTTDANHGIDAGGYVKLDGIQLSCDSWTGISTLNVVNFDYLNFVGLCTLTLSGDHGIEPGEYVRVENILLSCPPVTAGLTSTLFPYPAGINTFGNPYPQSSPNTLANTYNVFKTVAGTAGSTITINAGISTIDHTYVSGGTVTIGISTTLFPYDGSSQKSLTGTNNVFKTTSGTSGNTIVVDVGVSTIAHTYVSGGTATAGITSTIFPYVGSSTSFAFNSYDTFEIVGVPTTNKFNIFVGVSTIAHTYVSGGTAVLGITTSIFPDGTSEYGYTFRVTGVGSSTTFTINSGISTIPHEFLGYGQVGVSTFTYTESTGISTVVTSTSHGLSVGDYVTLDGLEFSCAVEHAGITTTIFPDGTSPYGKTFLVSYVASNKSFTFNAGISTIAHNYVSGGTAQKVSITKKVPTTQRVLRFPDVSTDGAYDFRVTSVGSTNQFTFLSAGSTISHYYTQSGIVSFRQFEEFTFEVEEVQTDKFTGLYPGQFIKFDDISQYFNGFRKKFTLSITNNNVKEVISLRTPQGSDLDITNNIFIYVNDILQSPGDSYTFSGSRVSFKEAPKENSTCTILYFRGSSVDVEDVEPPKTIKEGDFIQIRENKDDLLDTDQFDRVVKTIVSSDQLDTFTYDSLGINTNPTKIRPLKWQKQTRDRVISGVLYSKARPSLNSRIVPNAYVIKKVLPDDVEIYVDNAFPIFTDIDTLSEDKRNIKICETREISPAIGTCVVSSSSTISSIQISSGGVGYAYTSNPVITVSQSAITKKDPIKNWRTVSGLSTTHILNSVDHGNVFVSVGNSGAFAYSYDGADWQSDYIGYGNTVSFGVVSCGGTNIFMAGGGYGYVVKSVGYAQTITSWEKLNIIEEIFVPQFGVIGFTSSTYNETINDIVYNPQLDTWTMVGVATAIGAVFGASGIGTSVFTRRFTGTTKSLNSLAVGLSQIVAVGDDGVVIRSTNNSIWDTLGSVTFAKLNKVIFVGDRFIAVGNNGTIIRTVDYSGQPGVPDPSSFELLGTSLIPGDIVDIFYNDFYVALNSIGDLYYSFDLISWVYRPTDQLNSLNSIRFVSEVGLEGRYVSVGVNTAIYAEPIFNRTTAVSNVTAGVVTSISILDGGFGYSTSNPPSVLIEPDPVKTELVKSVKALGDFGRVIGINTFLAGTPGIGTTTPKVQFILQSDYYDNSTLGIGYSSLNSFNVTYSQLSKGDYFVIRNSNVTTGHPIIGITTSLGGMANYPTSKIGTATTFLDGVYRVEDVQTSVGVGASAGVTTVTCNLAPKSPNDNYVEIYKRGADNSGINTNGSSGTLPFYGNYSWGKLYDYQNRVLGAPETFEVYNDNGIVGIQTNPQAFRTRPV